MRVLVSNLRPHCESAINPQFKMRKFLVERIGFDAEINPVSKKFVRRSFDEIGIPPEEDLETWFINGSVFSEYREAWTEAIRCSKRVVWVQNDYLAEIPSQIRRVLPGVSEDCRLCFTTIPKRHSLDREMFRTIYVNWNAVVYDPIPLNGEPRIPGLFYYGQLRKGRMDYLEQFLGTDTGYNVTISTSNRRQKGYEAINPIADFIPVCESYEQMSKYAWTLYLEDETSHSLYCSPANRFYEALSAGVPMLFHRDAHSTMRTAELNVSEWLVSSPGDVLEFMKNNDPVETAKIQRHRFGSNHKLWMEQQFAEAYEILRTH